MPEASTTLLQGVINRMAAGEAAARTELVEHAYERLRRLTQRMMEDFRRVQRWEESGDVLQEASLRLLRALEAVPVTDVKGFFRLARTQIRRELIDLARRYYGPQGMGAAHATLDASADSTSQRDRVARHPESTHDPERLAAWTEFHNQVGALPEDERDVFESLWYVGMTQDETAAVLDVSVATVKRRWVAARLRLQAAAQALPRALDGLA